MAPDVATKTSIVVVVAFLLVRVRATTVNITQEWKPNSGWEIACLWQLYANDSLHAIYMTMNRQHFMQFRPDPENHSLNKKESLHQIENVMIVECIQNDHSGVTGKCVLTLEPQLPPKKDFTFGCKVLGEEPLFRKDDKEIFIEALVPPNDTEMTVTKHNSGYLSANCTATGLPAPTIVWTVDSQKVPHNFHSVPVWNATSKLYEVWSSFDPQPEDLDKLECTPESYKGRKVIKGQSLMFNGATRDTLSIGISLLLVLAALRR